MNDKNREVRVCEDIVNVLEERLSDLEKKNEIMDVEIESLIVSLDINHEIIETLDSVGVILYKLYNKIKGIIEE